MSDQAKHEVSGKLLPSAAFWADVPDARRAVMRAIKSKNTKPEMMVRRLVHSMGYRYRLHRANLPGKPDLTFGPCKKVIFVHGCFWHQHSDPECRRARMPLTRSQYWRPKLERNMQRDRRNVEDLETLGWGVQIIWECWLKDTSRTSEILRSFLDESGDERNG